MDLLSVSADYAARAATAARWADSRVLPYQEKITHIGGRSPKSNVSWRDILPSPFSSIR
jgi:hypothetical protein